MSSSRKWYTAPGSFPAYGPSRIRTSLLFAHDLSFALTVRKAQGQTLNSVVLCLSQRPTKAQQMVFSAMYVAFSRVKYANDIRLLIHCGTPRLMELRYLQNLKPNPMVQAF